MITLIIIGCIVGWLLTGAGVTRLFCLFSGEFHEIIVEERDPLITALTVVIWPSLFLMGTLWAIGKLISFLVTWHA